MLESDQTQPWRLRPLGINDALSRLALLVSAAPDSPIVGGLRGPFCPYARTLPAEYPWRRQEAANDNQTVARYLAAVAETCLWEPAHPFRYEASWAIGGGESQSLSIGFRVLRRQGDQLTLNGSNWRVRGMGVVDSSDAFLRELHDWGCNLLVGLPGPFDSNDRFGPFVAVSLPDELQDACNEVSHGSAVRPSIGMYLLPDSCPEEWVDRYRELEATTLFARLVEGAATERTVDGADVLLVADTLERLTERVAECPTADPWVGVVVDQLPPGDELAWRQLSTLLDDRLSTPPCVGWIVGATGNS